MSKANLRIKGREIVSRTTMETKRIMPIRMRRFVRDFSFILFTLVSNYLNNSDKRYHMGVLKVLSFPIRLMHRIPKVVLPSVLIWIPLIMFNALFVHVIARSQVFNWISFMQGMYSAEMWEKVLSFIVPYAALGILIILISLGINLFLKCTYVSIIQQSRRRKVSLSKAFSTAKSRFWSLVWTYFLLLVLYISAFIVLFIVFMVLALLGPVGVVLDVFLVLFVVVGLLASMVLIFLIDPIVVLEKKGGLEAIERSVNIVQKSFLQALVVIIASFLLIFFVEWLFMSIPGIGSSLSYLVRLFTMAYAMSIPATFYFVYKKK